MKIKSSRASHSTVAIALGSLLLSVQFLPSFAAQAPSQPAQENKPQQRVRTPLEGFDLSAKPVSSPNPAAGTSRGNVTSPTKLYAPNSGKVYDTNPFFQWSSSEPNAKVTFRLSTVDGQVVYEEKTTSDHLKYSTDAPKLVPGNSYKWTIVPEVDKLGGTPAPDMFLIVAGPERDQITNELNAAQDEIGTANVMIKHHIWYDTIEAYTEMIERLPNDPEPLAGRANLYYSLPATKDLSDADWKMVH